MPDGTKMHFLSEKTLHIVDRVLWMLPFATNTDLNEAAKKADISHKSRNGFIQKHSIIGARQQLKEHWGKWIESSHSAAGPESAGRGYGAEAETPEDSGNKEAVNGSQASGSAAAGAAAAVALAKPAAAAAESSASQAVAAQAAAAAAGPAPAAAAPSKKWTLMPQNGVITSCYCSLLLIAAHYCSILSIEIITAC
jgi:hypothetical protein